MKGIGVGRLCDDFGVDRKLGVRAIDRHQYHAEPSSVDAFHGYFSIRKYCPLILRGIKLLTMVLVHIEVRGGANSTRHFELKCIIIFWHRGAAAPLDPVLDPCGIIFEFFQKIVSKPRFSRKIRGD